MTDTPMVIMPREATGEMKAAMDSASCGVAEIGFDPQAHEWASAIAASPASGKVTKEQAEKMAKAYFESFSGNSAWSLLLPSSRKRGIEAARAALASIGLEVE
jgi:hypothetical protein